MSPDARRELCRRLRREQTPAERFFWELVRNHRFQGVQFRRQHPLGRFVLDFYCPVWRLAVELDGSSHAGQGERDRERDLVLAQHGIRVVRLRNEDLLADPQGALAGLPVGPTPSPAELERGAGTIAAPALSERKAGPIPSVPRPNTLMNRMPHAHPPGSSSDSAAPPQPRVSPLHGSGEGSGVGPYRLAPTFGKPASAACTLSAG